MNDVNVSRNWIGFLGIALPIITLFGKGTVLYTGVAFALGTLLIQYRGYDRRDWLFSTGAGVGAIAMALFPQFFAGICVLFLMLMLINGFQFIKLGEIVPTSRKHTRNLLYSVFAITIAAALVIGFFAKWKYAALIGEWVAFWAFGFSWLMKGGLILADKDELQ